MFRSQSVYHQNAERLAEQIGLPPHVRQLPLNQQLAYQRERHQEAHDRFYAGMGEIEDENGQHRTYIMYSGDSDEEHVPQIQRLRVTTHSASHGRIPVIDNRMADGEHSLSDFCLISVYFLRCHIKLMALIAIIIYFKEVTQAQVETHGWYGTRRVGFQQRDLCTSKGSKYSVLEYEWNKFAPDQKTSVVVEADARLNPCIDIETAADLTSLLQNTPDYNLEKFNSQDYLENGVANAGEVRTYFPNALGIMLCAYAAALLTLALETLPRATNRIDLNLSEGEKNTVIRANHVMCIILCTLLFVSGAAYSLLQEESCINNFGITDEGPLGNSKHNQQQQEDALTMCAEIDKMNVIISSVISPSEPYVRVYSSFATALSIILMVGMLVKPDLDEEPYAVSSTQLPRALMQLFGSNRRARIGPSRDRMTRNRQVRVGAGNNGVNIGLAAEFMRRYSDVARRNKITKDWKIMSKPDGPDITVEERERCCTICLDLLFPEEIGEKSVTGGAGAGAGGGGGNVSSQSQSAAESEEGGGGSMTHPPVPDELDESARLSAKEKPAESDAKDPYKREDEIVFCLPCGHRYHKPCILEWAFKNTTCPECRASLDTGLPENAPQSSTDDIEEESDLEEHPERQGMMAMDHELYEGVDLENGAGGIQIGGEEGGREGDGDGGDGDGGDGGE